MQIPLPPIEVLNKEQRDHYLQFGYNPPNYTDKFRREDYLKEWDNAVSTVQSSVSQHWQHGVGGEGDFFMDTDVAPGRLMCIEVLNEDMLDPKLLHVVHSALSRLESEYSVDICDDWVFLETASGNQYPHFNIFVQKDRIKIFSESNELLARFGVSLPTN